MVSGYRCVNMKKLQTIDLLIVKGRLDRENRPNQGRGGGGTFKKWSAIGKRPLRRSFPLCADVELFSAKAAEIARRNGRVLEGN
jgi:hypothetical protein